MIPMDNFEKWQRRLNQEKFTGIFRNEEKVRWQQIPLEKRIDLLKTIFENPIGNVDVMHPWYFRNKWAEALLMIRNQAPVRLLELASGANDVIPRALAFAFNHPETSYVAANTNKDLTKWFKNNVKDISINIEIIEDDAKSIEDYAEKESFDFVVFEHAVNDIIFDTLCREKGIDTVNVPWFDFYGDIIKFTNEAYENGSLESIVKEKLLGIFASCLNVLKQGSYIIINHFMYQYDLDAGINYNFWENVLPMTRKWVNEAGIGKEIFFDGFDPQWWMFIKKGE